MFIGNAYLSGRTKDDKTMEGGFFFDLFMGFCKLCILLTWILLLVFFLVMLPCYIVGSIIDAIKGKPGTPLSDSFINFWSAHSDRSDD